MVGSLYQPPPPSLPVAATAATLLLAVAAALAAVATLLLAVVVALAVATAAATEKSIDALRQSDRAVLRGLPIRLEEAHSHSDGAVHGAPSAGHSGSRHSDPSSQEQPSGKSFDGRGGKFIPTPTTLSRRGRTVRPPFVWRRRTARSIDSEGGDCGAEGRHFAPGGGEALYRNGARKKEKKTLAKVAAKRKQSRTSEDPPERNRGRQRDVFEHPLFEHPLEWVAQVVRELAHGSLSETNEEGSARTRSQHVVVAATVRPG